jgi:hypothetical protein
MRLVMADDSVLNSSLCCTTTHTHTGHTGAGHYNSYHQLLIGVIISAMTDLSIAVFYERKVLQEEIINFPPMKGRT